MPQVHPCPNCHGRFQVPDDFAGAVHCPHCGLEVTVAQPRPLQPREPPVRERIIVYRDRDEDEPRERPSGSFATGFGLVFGGCLGIVVAILLLNVIAVILRQR